MKEVPKFKLHEEDDISRSKERKKNADRERHRETEHGGFSCSHCNEWAPINEHIGTHNRNHCPHCLWSRHMDDVKLGDRKSECKSGMEPIALTLKEEGSDRYADLGRRLGEIMLIHRCTSDGTIRINRIAADDNPHQVMDVLYSSVLLPEETLVDLHEQHIVVATVAVEDEIRVQLFGR